MISIVIPTFNRASVIPKTLDSVLSQTFHDWECLVVDDYSTDNTKEIVLNFCNKDNRFKYLINEEKKGANGARNTGILHAKGDYVSFLDSDDTWEAEMLTQQFCAYNKDENVSCVYAKIQTVLPNGAISSWNIYSKLEGHIYSEVLSQGFLTGTISLSAKRNCLIEIGMFDLELPSSQDDDMCFKLAKHYKIAFINQILANAYIASENRISNNSSKVSMGWWMLWNKYEADVIEYCGKDVMAKHYKECLHHFIQSNNVRMSWKAYKKFLRFGGNLSKRKTLWFMAYILSFGKNHHITRKIQNKI